MTVRSGGKQTGPISNRDRDARVDLSGDRRAYEGIDRARQRRQRSDGRDKNEREAGDSPAYMPVQGGFFCLIEVV